MQLLGIVIHYIVIHDTSPTRVLSKCFNMIHNLLMRMQAFSYVCMAYVYHIVWISLCGPICQVWCQVSLSFHTHSVHDVSLPVHGLHLPVCTWCVLPGVDLSVHGIIYLSLHVVGLSVYGVYYNVHGTRFLTL